MALGLALEGMASGGCGEDSRQLAHPLGTETSREQTTPLLLKLLNYPGSEEQGGKLLFIKNSLQVGPAKAKGQF